MYIEKSQKGFTLIELLIVIGIIAILAAAVIIAITPGERLHDAREATRLAHMSAIGTAMHVAVVDKEEFSSIFDILDDCGSNGTTTGDFSTTCAASIGMTAPTDPENSAWYYQVNADSTTTDSRLEIAPHASATTDIATTTY